MVPALFEITHRDAAARIGKLMLDPERSTPAIIQLQENDGPIANAGSLWGKVDLPHDTHTKIVILPHKSVPLHTREDVVAELQDSVDADEEVERVRSKVSYTGLVVHPLVQRLQESAMYVLGAAKQLENHPRELVRSIIHLKENTRADSLLYVPALATPENLSMLIYLGVDLVDSTLPEIKGYQDLYLTSSGEYHLDRVREFPCTCAVCSSHTPPELTELPKKERAELLSLHNALNLEEEMRNIREHIRSGNLREYVERQCRVRPWLTAALRLVDAEHSFLEKRTPVFRSGTLFANTQESLTRVELRRFEQRVLERFRAPALDTLVLLPCSARKPYSTSLSHQKFINAMGKYRQYVHEVIISSPLGVVPRELELLYPAAHYDTPVTGYWDREERAWVEANLKNYLLKNQYETIIAHVDGAYREICQAVERELGLDVVYTAEQGVTARASLENLREAIRGRDRGKRRSPEEAKLDVIRAAADYQFGRGAGDLLAGADARIKAPFPKFQLFSGSEQLATLIPRYGGIALTIAGGLKLQSHPYYRVTIGDFLPKSSILAPGVLDADPQIRPHDEVLVEGERMFGVGRAQMSGWEMLQTSRGVAVELRHSLEKG